MPEKTIGEQAAKFMERAEEEGGLTEMKEGIQRVEKSIVEVLERFVDEAERRQASDEEIKREHPDGLFQMKPPEEARKKGVITASVCFRVSPTEIWSATPKGLNELKGKEAYLWGVMQRPEIRLLLGSGRLDEEIVEVVKEGLEEAKRMGG